MLNQAYDSTLNEIYAELKCIDAVEDEEDLIEVRKVREDIELDDTVTWQEVKNEIKTDVA